MDIRDSDAYFRRLGQQQRMQMSMMGQDAFAAPCPMPGLGHLPMMPENLTRLKMAADVQARTLSMMHAQLEQHMELIKLLDDNITARCYAEPAAAWAPASPQAEANAAAQQAGALPVGMTLRLAAAGLTPEGAPTPSFAKPLPPEARARVVSQMAKKASHKLEREQRREAAPKAGRPLHAQRREDTATLRTYLEELRSKDSRCVFVARRINKLGFKSKSLLQEHFSWYGEVARVLVAHSKVKPSEECAYSRTRPGNFGFVIMSSPEDVQRVLAEGEWQTVSGVEIQVHKFEHNQMEKEFQENATSTGLNLQQEAQTQLVEQQKDEQQPVQKKGSSNGSGNEDDETQSTLDSASGAWGRNTTASSADMSQSAGWGHQTTSGSTGTLNSVTETMSARSRKNPSEKTSLGSAGSGSNSSGAEATNATMISSQAEAETIAQPTVGLAADPATPQKRVLGTLATHLEELKNVDEGRIFVARRINKLGFSSREILKMHFARYGEVSRVLVAHSKISAFCDQTAKGKRRFRPGGLGLVVMQQPARAKAILACEEHIIAGHKIHVQSFRRHGHAMSTATGSGSTHSNFEEGTSDGSGLDQNKSEEGSSNQGGSSNPCEGTPEGTSNDSSLKNKSSEAGSENKSSEGGSEPCEKQDPDADAASTGALSAASGAVTPPS